METSTPTFDQLPYVANGLSEKLDQVLDLLEKAGIASHSKQSKPSRRLVYAKEACRIIGKSLSTWRSHRQRRYPDSSPALS